MSSTALCAGMTLVTVAHQFLVSVNRNGGYLVRLLHAPVIKTLV